MGLSCTKASLGDAIRPVLRPPVSKLSLNTREVLNILSEATKCHQIFLWDSKYDTIELDDVQRFLVSNINTKYKSDRSDCDDFSIHLCSRFREFAYNMNGSGGPLFGIMTGDLRLKDNDPPRSHAVCFFIDSKKKVWIVDGMWNEIHEIVPSMTFWTIIV